MLPNKEIKVHEIPTHITDELLQNISSYSVFLLKMSDERGSDAIMIGSGTLVSYRGYFAILTAGHVIRNKKWDITPDGESEYLGVAAGGSENSLKFRISHLRYFGEYNLNECPCGPDFALILLPEPSPELSALKALASFWSIDNKNISSKALECDLSSRMCWTLVGFPGEWVHTEKSTKSRGAIHGEGVVGPAGLEGLIEGTQYDLFIASIVEDELYEGPRDFSGVSGGGLWSTILRVDDSNRLTCDRPLLMGMPIFQTSSLYKKRFIFCQGRKTIYESVREIFESIINTR